MPYTREWTDSVTITEQSNGFNRSSTVNFQNIRTGEKNPLYQSQQSAGLNAGTPYYLDAQKVLRSVPGNVQMRWRHTLTNAITTEFFRGFQISSQPSTVQHLNGSSLEANSEALSKMYKKIKSEHEQFNSAASAAEFYSVLKQFGRPARSLVDLTHRHLNRLALAQKGLSGSTSFKRIRYDEIVASSYLEWVFGIAPLISDTENAAIALARWNSEKELQNLRTRLVSRAQRDATATSSGIVQAANTSLLARINDLRVTERRVQYVVGLQATPLADFESNERLLQLLGFNHANWIPAAWEVVPWSWLFDYFFNVNNILEAAVTNVTNVRWIVRTDTTVTTWSRVSEKARAQLNPGFQRLVDITNDQFSHFGASQIRRTTLNRTLPQSLGIPPLYFRHPFKDAKKIANMWAALWSRRSTPSNPVWIS